MAQNATRKIHGKLLADGVRIDPRWRDHDTFKAEAGKPPEGAVGIEPVDPRRPLGVTNARWVVAPRAKKAAA